MNIIQKLIPIGHPNRPGWKLDGLKAIVVHYTCNRDPDATDIANDEYFGRSWAVGADGKPVEATRNGTPLLDKDGKQIPFEYGSAHTIADQDAVMIAIPPDEVAWGCGDRPMPWDDLNRGQRPAARLIFQNRQNLNTVSVEICNNADWNKAASNAAEWIAGFLKSRGLRVNVPASLDPQHFSGIANGEILILRHYDVTGKICPAPFIDQASASVSPAWIAFVKGIAEKAAV
jgi:N-acetylmuramoyl-L-alanine amidase